MQKESLVFFSLECIIFCLTQKEALFVVVDINIYYIFIV